MTNIRTRKEYQDITLLTSLNASHGKRELPEDVSDEVISFAERKVEVKPAPNQYTNYFFYFALFCHALTLSNFYTSCRVCLFEKLHRID